MTNSNHKVKTIQKKTQLQLKMMMKMNVETLIVFDGLLFCAELGYFMEKTECSSSYNSGSMGKKSEGLGNLSFVHSFY